MQPPPAYPKVPMHPSDEHDFHVLGPRGFEEFARALHEAQPGIQGTLLYAPDAKQFGADHVAFHRGDHMPWLEIGQSKAHKTFSASQIRRAAKDFTDHWETHWQPKNVRRFILFVGCTIKSQQAADAIIELTAEFAGRGLEFSVWAANAIYDRLSSAQGVVRAHLGQDWYSKLFGEPAGPLTGLVRDLESGNRSALEVMGIVGRLNQAESAEIAELRRRARRGELDAVIADLDDQLFGTTAGATAREIRAEKLRLLAALIIRRRDFERARRLLDEADGLDGTSERLRAILLLESVGAAAAIEAIANEQDTDFAEIRAVARMRLGDPKDAFDELAAIVAGEEASAEALRLAALAKLAANERGDALGLAKRAVARDPDARAPQQALAICLFHAALSPASDISLGEWPQPVDLPLVASSEAAREHLEAAEKTFSRLAEDASLDEHRAMLIWRVATLACMPWRRQEVEALIADLQAKSQFPIPLAAWCVSRELPFDLAAAIAQCEAQIAEDPGDFETLLIRVALANFQRDHTTARHILDGARDTLTAAGHDALYDYWTAVLDMEARRPPDADALVAHPWLGLRVALDIRRKRERLDAVARLLVSEVERDGDPRVILASAQLLLDGGWHKSAVKAASWLIEHVGTAEAIGTAAHALYRNERSTEVLAALERIEAFPGNRLPSDLERLKAECLAMSGDLIAARDSVVALAGTTGQARDIWRSIDFFLATGAEPAALALYEQHEQSLEQPTAGHLRLAQAIAHSNPQAAARIARQVAGAAPDDLVAATYTLAHKLRLDAEQHMLMGRMTMLGQGGAGGIRLVNFEEVKAWIEERRQQAEQAFEQYANGHAPFQLAAIPTGRSLPFAYLAPLLDPPQPGVRTAILSTRYGRRYEEDVWPQKRGEVALLADLSALLTANGLDLLDTVERAFAPIRIAPDTLNALLAMRTDLQLPDPDRAAAAERVIARFNTGTIMPRGSGADIDGFTILDDLEGAEPSATLNLARLAETMGSKKGKAKLSQPTPFGEAQGAIPPAGSRINLEVGDAVTLEAAGLLDAVLKKFTIAMAADAIDRLRGELREGENVKRMAASLADLSARIGTGLEDGAYRMVPIVRIKSQDPAVRSFEQLLEAMRDGQSIFWVDDRFTSQIDAPSFRVVTTVEVMAALGRYGRLDRPREAALRQRLRQARWMFMPVDDDELVDLIRPATRNGEVDETEALAILRRSIGEMLAVRRRLQWPAPPAGEDVRGEIPFLLDLGHAVVNAMARIWSDDNWSIEDAGAASAWLIDHVDTGLFPMPILGPGDPRSDHMIGTHMGGLVLAALQVRAGKIADPRQRAYLEWLHDNLVRPSLRIRPEFRQPMEQMIETHLASRSEGPLEDRIWRQVSGNMLNALPDDLRDVIVGRPAIRTHFDLPEHGMITFGDLQFDEKIFWAAAANATLSHDLPIAAMSGEKGKLRLTEYKGRPRITIRMAKRGLHLDDWPWAIAQDDSAIRRAALDTQVQALDLPPAQLEVLDNLLGTLSPAERARRVQEAARASAARWYIDLGDRIAKREPFRVADLMPEDITAVVRLLRLDADLNEAARTLIEERGLAIAIRRLGGLPIVPPQVIEQAINALDEPQLEVVLAEAELDTAPPWVQLFVAAMLAPRALTPSPLGERIRTWIDSALSDMAKPYWRLYGAVARYTMREATVQLAWRGLNGTQQLAACWIHASSVTEIVAAGNILIDPLIELIEDNQLVTPRLIVEETTAFAGDCADPRHGHAARSRAYAAAPALAIWAASDTHRERAQAHLRALTITGPEDNQQPNVGIAAGGLRRDDRLASYFSKDWHALFDAANPGSGALFGEGLEALATTVLATEPTDDRPASGWPFIRFASGDAPLPEPLASAAQAAARTAPLPGSEGEPSDDDLQALCAFAQVAAANHWHDQRASIETALARVDPDQFAGDEQARLYLFETILSCAMLEPDPLARTRILGQHLTQLSHCDRLKGTVEQMARHFARGLPGQYAEALVDTLAELWSTH
jgi:hypothetical protein